MAAMAVEVAKALGPVEILVNNAGIGHVPQPLETLAEADFDHIWAVNVKSVYLTAKYLVPAMKAAGRGAVLNVASTGGVSPRPNLTWYNASKGWMITATRAMAVELAPFGVRVNAINPVAGETPLLATFMGQDTPENRAKFLLICGFRAVSYNNVAEHIIAGPQRPETNSRVEVLQSV